MKIFRRLWLLPVLISVLAPLGAQTPTSAPKPASAPKTPPNFMGQMVGKFTPTREIVYKKVGDRELMLHIFEPTGAAPAGPRGRAAFIGIHGGGWTSGSPRVMYAFTDWAARHGMVGISVQYRLYKPKTAATVRNCVEDARSAVRYVRARAKELGIDPERIVVSGASAGGHLAVAAALLDGMDDPGEDTTVSCRPDGLVLLSPVIDTSKEGYGNAKVGPNWQEFSPRHRVQRGMPPTITFHGTVDATTPFKGAQEFQDEMVKVGNDSELVKVEGSGHTYMFKDAALYEDTLRRLERFLTAHGFLAKE